MRSKPSDSLERYRILGPPGENNGAFQLESPVALRIIVSDGMGWDHVSVSLPHRCPTWYEMNLVKGMFFEDEEAVIQFHPPKSTYRNCHPYCLHLWRPQNAEIPLPDPDMVGPSI